MQNSEERARANVRVASGVNVALGAWLIVAPFALGYTTRAAYLNDAIAGVLVLILAGSRLAAMRTPGLSWANLSIGLWLIVAPFALAFPAERALWNDLLLGVLLAIFSGWSAVSVPRVAMERR